MPRQKVLCQESISERKLPVNFNRADAGLFEHEIERTIPTAVLLYMEGITIDPTGILFYGNKVLPQSFPSPDFLNDWTRLKCFIKYRLLKPHKRIEQDAFWITDFWSQAYFHWMTDALPRLLTIQEKLGEATLLLPKTYESKEYVVSSLKPFSIKHLSFIRETCYRRKFLINKFKFDKLSTFAVLKLFATYE